jgi:hypothetical protein
MAELAASLSQRTVRLANNGNAVAAFEQYLAFLKYSDFLTTPTRGCFGVQYVKRFQ